LSTHNVVVITNRNVDLIHKKSHCPFVLYEITINSLSYKFSKFTMALN
jgi:hypothetical protein